MSPKHADTTTAANQNFLEMLQSSEIFCQELQVASFTCIPTNFRSLIICGW